MTRSAFLAIAILLAACGQNVTHAPDRDPPKTNSSILGATPASGQWFFQQESDSTSAGFGVPNSEFQFIVTCNANANRVELTSSHELVPDQDTTLRIIVDAGTLDFGARSSNEGLPFVNAEVAADDPRLDMLAAAQEVFAVSVAGETTVYPWDESLSRAIGACGGE